MQTVAMPTTTEQAARNHRNNYRGYLMIMFLLLLSITFLLMFNASDSWGAIIALLVCMLLLAVKLWYDQRQYQQSLQQRERDLLQRQVTQTHIITNDGFISRYDSTLQEDVLITEYVLAMAAEERQRQPVYTISLSQDNPPDYDSVTKTNRPPRLSRTTREADIPSIHSTTSNQSLQSGRSRQDTAVSDRPNATLTSAVQRERPNLALQIGITPPSVPAEMGPGVDSPQPPSYDEALAARIYQQLGLENR